MATIYAAIDPVDGHTLPDGEMVGLDDSAQGLINQGFAAATYSASNNRLAEIDDTTENWNNDCIVGGSFSAEICTILEKAVRTPVPVTVELAERAWVTSITS